MPFRSRDFSPDLNLLNELEEKLDAGQLETNSLPSTAQKSSTNSSESYENDSITPKQLLVSINSQSSSMINPLSTSGKVHQNKGKRNYIQVYFFGLVTWYTFGPVSSAYTTICILIWLGVTTVFNAVDCYNKQ